MITDKETQEINITINDLDKVVRKRDTLLQLQDNTLFKEIITEGYFKDNAVRLVTLKGASQMSEDKEQKNLDNQIMAVGLLAEHFRAVITMGDIAEKRLNDYTEELANSGGNV
jgi:hypothetical protein